MFYFIRLMVVTGLINIDFNVGFPRVVRKYSQYFCLLFQRCSDTENDSVEIIY